MAPPCPVDRMGLDEHLAGPVGGRLAFFDPPVHPAEKTVFSALAPAEVARETVSREFEEMAARRKDGRF